MSTTTKVRKEGESEARQPDDEAKKQVVQLVNTPSVPAEKPQEPPAPARTRGVRYWESVRGGLIEDKLYGNVLARIYANEDHRRQITFKLELTRLFTTGTGSGEAFSYTMRDLPDARRCLKWARSWLAQAERRLIGNPREIDRLIADKKRRENSATSGICTEAPPRSRKEYDRGRVREWLAADETFGNVVSEITVIETVRGAASFKVEIYRLYNASSGAGESFTFEMRDISDAIEAFNWAESWLWKEDRRRAKAAKRRWHY